jgi:predicted DNA-binding transcriptional regulator AlpA
MTAANPTEARRTSPLATVPEIASEFGLTAWHAYELIRQGKLPQGIVVRFGPRTTRINRARWSEFVEQGGLK